MHDVAGLDLRALPEAVLMSEQPLLLRGAAAHWPAVQAAQRGRDAAMQAIARHWRGATVGALLAPPAAQGRFFYNDDLTGFNFSRQAFKLDQVLMALQRAADEPDPPAIYVGSTTVDTCLPGFRAEQDAALNGRDALCSIWLGNRTRIAAHQDVPDNLAVVVAGRRRFTLFAPDETPNLYIGPLDFTPAGQAISLVDFHRPDLQRFPRFAQARARAHVAELGPGDALLIPSLWWHHVESLDPFNVLVNYWWRTVSPEMVSPVNALMLALASVRDLPPAQREAWRRQFDHYVFGAGDDTAAHIPPHARGVLGPLDDEGLRLLRQNLARRLQG